MYTRQRQGIGALCRANNSRYSIFHTAFNITEGGVCFSMLTLLQMFFGVFFPHGPHGGFITRSSRGLQQLKDCNLCSKWGMRLFWSGAQLVKQSLNAASAHLYQNWSAHRSLAGGRGGPSKMGHQLSALQQKLNLTNAWIVSSRAGMVLTFSPGTEIQANKIQNRPVQKPAHKLTWRVRLFIDSA